MLIKSPSQGVTMATRRGAVTPQPPPVDRDQSGAEVILAPLAEVHSAFCTGLSFVGFRLETAVPVSRLVDRNHCEAAQVG